MIERVSSDDAGSWRAPPVIGCFEWLSVDEGSPMFIAKSYLPQPCVTMKHLLAVGACCFDTILESGS